MDVFKFTKGDEDAKLPLANAQFQLLLNGVAVKLTKVEDTEGVPTYMVDNASEADTITTDENGKFIIVGLDADLYKLHETEAPAGYNKLASDLTVDIVKTYNEQTKVVSYEINNADPATIEVENKTGAILPETGGIGTTIFYVVGGVLMAAALIVLVSKKRMASFA